ncbi:MAG: hypothetical protein K9N11_06435 [Lentisphaeria bacterium]|nr:hypothetical protein [Candidatus Neomarinimicrobiota bacterium]MCF7842472.1 hypothetical protein [Lentisphaeria bacterium]
MTKLWDDVKKSLKDFSSAAMEKAEEFGKVASDKAEELTKVGKINWEIKQLKRTREKHLQELGQMVYDAAESNAIPELADNDEITERIREIKSVNAEIKIKQDRIDAIHAEFGMPSEEVMQKAESEAAEAEGNFEKYDPTDSAEPGDTDETAGDKPEK